MGDRRRVARVHRHTRRHGRQRVLIAGVAAVACAMSSIAWLDADATRAVTVHVSVEAVDGSFVVRLAPDSLDAVVNGATHPIDSIESAVDAASIVLLVDLSFSSTRGTGRHVKGPPGIIRHDFMGLVRAIERLFVGALRAQDRLSIGGFAGSRLLFTGDFATRRDDQLAAVEWLIGRFAREQESDRPSGWPFTPSLWTPPPEIISVTDWLGASPIWDAVVSTASLLASQPPPRAIVLVTDGQATGNRWSMADAVLEAAAQGVAVHVMYQPETWGVRPNPHVDGDRFLRPLAESTGGVFRVNDGVARGGWRDAPPPFEDMVAAIHNAHAIRMNVGAQSAEPQTLELRIKQPGLRVHAPKWIVVR
jgi:hypothetical protein